VGLIQPRHRTLNTLALREDADCRGHMLADEKFVDLKFICSSTIELSGEVS
jgi:hypothetical protein